MKAAAPSALPGELAIATARKHDALAVTGSAAPTGRQMGRRLEVRLDRLTARAAASTTARTAALIGLDWIVENQHVMHEAIERLRGNLQRGFVRKLPAIAEVPPLRQPRAAALAEIVVRHCELPLDMASVERFLADYQSESPLTLGELWALPAFLRATVLTELCDALETGLAYAEDRGQTAPSAASVGTLSGAILSLRTLAATDWRAFVERQSVTEKILADDPSGDYPRMDADTRNRYRERVERLARRYSTQEWEVAKRAVAVARESAHPGMGRLAHVGYYLLDDGVRELELALLGRSSLRIRACKLRTFKPWLYLLSIVAPAFGSLWFAHDLLILAGTGIVARASLLPLLTILMLTVWTELVNWLVTQTFTPKVLPKLDFSNGIPADFGTIVAVPCMLTNTTEIDRLIHALEISYLGNDDPRLRFVLLTDFVDARTAEDETDAELLRQAVSGIDELNVRYAERDLRPFALFHRRRVWNDNARLWMGWERKRGKIEEFNRWLMGAGDTTVSLVHGDAEAMRAARFVITLDADNQLLPGAAAKLAGTLAHPLNRPRFDAETRRVTAGYTVVQPRVDAHPASANRTVFSRLMTGDTGIDLYQLAVSDAYQDLFGQGIYAGKGIYDIRAFRRTLQGRIPSNAVLSHDLLEGVIGRAAYASDIVLLEKASPNLATELDRQHRWIRGDWQLLPWLFPIPGRPATGPGIDLLGRWKLFDNLRRSLEPPALLVLLLAGWVLLPDHRLVWTAAMLLVPAMRIGCTLCAELRWSTIRWGTLRSTLRRLAGRSGKQIAQYLVNLANLPVLAAVATDAVLRTLARLTITHKRLLEWKTFAQSERSAAGAGLAANYRRAAAAPVSGIAALAIAAASESAAPIPVLFGIVWCAAPWIAWLMARERQQTAPLSGTQVAELRKLARRTWQFYERFVGPESHWLPPDNYQEAPKAALAERTSPTNIGLYLLAVVAAFDLGYVGTSGLLMRLDGTTATLRRMKRFRGHLFNWYDTRDLAVLAPDYVSTVDSGNLLAALLICRNTLENLDQARLPQVRAAASLGDIVANITDLVCADDTEATGLAPVLEVLAGIEQKLAETPRELAAWAATVAEIRDVQCARLDDTILALAVEKRPAWGSATIEALRSWVIQLRSEADVLGSEIANTLATWRASKGFDVEDAQQPSRLASIVAQVENARRQSRSDTEIPETARPGDHTSLRHAAQNLDELAALRARILRRIDAIVAMTDFGFLFDRSRKLFHLGYNNTSGELDPGYYDLLASEARIASIVAIAKGDVPVAHWVHLGRPVRRIGGMRVLLSWSATAFEYLMPRLFMATPPHGLLDLSCRAVIREQRRLARRGKAPWGVSESAYSELDASGHYKYFAFGVDSLAIRSAATRPYVVSPYASLLALPYEPRDVVVNLERLRSLGCWGRYGLYEALDFGVDRDPKTRPRVVRTFMAHHQAMILAAIANALCDDSLLRRFHANRKIAAVEHLLYESLPKRAEDRVIRHPPPLRRRVLPAMPAEHVPIAPRCLSSFVNVVGNGHLTVRTTGRGSGDILWNEQAITRWQPRSAGPEGGDRIYVTDADSGVIRVLGTDDEGQTGPELWSAPFQTELHQRFDDLRARLTVGVAPDNDVAIKRVSLTNESGRSRKMRVTHYAEIALASAAADRRHPAFNKLFIESVRHEERSAVSFRRRARGVDESGLCCTVGVIVAAESRPKLSLETDRRRFLGRAADYRRPAALSPDYPHGAEVADSLDPAAVLTVTLELPPGSTAQLAFLTAVSSEPGQALELLEHFRSFERIGFGIDQARRRAATELTALSIDSVEVSKLLGLYSAMLWPNPLSPDTVANMDLSQSVLNTLWARGISGDYPIAMACLHRATDSELAERLLILQGYLGRRGITVDVILADESRASYAEPVRDRLDELIEKYRQPHARGRVFVVVTSTLSPAERAALDSAMLVRLEKHGIGPSRLRQQRIERSISLPDFVPTRSPDPSPDAEPPADMAAKLEFDNGYGGVDAETGDYVIRVAASKPTPAPWINVLANPVFGSLVSERGAATTWFGNSSEERLTPWHNDPVRDHAGEAVYLRDEETGEFWSPMPWPIPGGEHYLVRHKPGVTSFEHNSHELEQTTDCFVDRDYPVKCLRIRLRNRSRRQRRFTLTCFAEWVFGNHYEDSGPFVFTDVNPDRNTLLAHNRLPRFGHERTAFVTSTETLHGHTTDRREFLGSARDPAHPAAMRRLGLSGDCIAGGEPCCTFQIHVDLGPRQHSEVWFTIGAGDNRDAALELAERFREPAFVAARFEATTTFWRDQTTGCRVQTPNRALDVLFNHWLLYQNLACRVWGRTGLYQSAGGYGFRDQLQDCLALVHVRPDLTRAQILKACAVQFAAGDVLHWWHEAPLRGVRSRCSDDLLWLPYVVTEYVLVTGDRGILDERVPFLAGEPLRDDEAERYAEFSPGGLSVSVFEHCRRAIDARAPRGRHGLPLIGGGDWNDGLNRVGLAGRGESAWLGWFLADVYRRFARLATQYGDELLSVEYRRCRQSLTESLERNAWDEAWYLRAYYDDGATLGAAADTECKIDLNAQTWPAITGLADRERAGIALDSAAEHLVDPDHRLIKLLAPPFDRTLKDPGYIKGYPPGVRENGGQYTHAAVWAVWAAVEQQRPEQAMAWVDLLNPLLRVTDEAAAERYLGEPYVLAGDVYSVAPRTGQAGWTWYTGSAGWLYRIVLDKVLGFQPRDGVLHLQPCVPDDWPEYQIDFRVGGSNYAISVVEPAGIASGGARFELDGKPVESIRLVDDGADHRVVASPADPGPG